MSETKAVVQTVLVQYRCNECDNGTMKPSGIILTSNPPQYPHECNSCFHKQTFLIKYPYTEYKEVKFS